MAGEMRLIATFDAKSEFGKAYEIQVWQSFVEIPNRGGVQEVAGKKSLTTSDGQAVNWVERGRYTLVHSGLELTSDDPNAE